MAASSSFDKSDTGVANLALTYLGDSNLNNLLEDRREAKVLRRFYTQARDFLIQTKSWNWCGKIETLALVTNDWDDRWTYKYNYGNWLAFRGVLRPGFNLRWDPDPPPFERLGDAIYTDMADAKAIVVEPQEDVGVWPAYFIEALAVDLAARAVMPLTKNVKLAKEVREQRIAVISTALAADANTDDNRPDYEAESIAARQ